jgi:hypothetical protein
MQALTDTGTGSIVGLNYTGNGIQEFTINGAWGGNVLAYSGGGGFVCCVTYPRIWTPTFAVKVKWSRSAGREPGGTQWRIIELERTVNIEKYQRDGNVYVLFLPDDQVKIYVSIMGVGSSEFPSNPGYPEDARK